MRKVDEYVDFVVQDCPILGRKEVRHYLLNNNIKGYENNINNEGFRKGFAGGRKFRRKV